MLNIKHLNIYLLVTLSTLFSQTSIAQTKVLDPAGYVNKYNPDFKGIGPLVYVLPAPRTKEEALTDDYNETRNFEDSISRILLSTRLLNDFKATSNQKAAEEIITETPQNQKDLNSTIQKFVANKNFGVAYALLNAQSRTTMENNELAKSTNSIHEALNLAKQDNKIRDYSILSSNLSTLSILNKNYLDALAAEEIWYKYAVNQNSLSDQANSLVKTALIQALNKNYNLAENTIIRKAIPILNKVQDYAGKAEAWITLAEIYQLQNKHTEAQWFLIQARDLATSKKLDQKLPLIEYMLGSSKFIQQNYKVSHQELSKALDLVSQTENKALELAIVDQLGRASMKLKKYDEADKLLAQYWSLRNELFN